MNIDFEVVKFLNHLGSPWIDPATKLISSNLLLVVLWIAVTAGFLVYDKKNGRKIAAAAIVAFILHFLISEGFFKYLLPEFGLFRVRPYLAYPGDIIPLGALNTDSSFPSSHMSSTLAILTVYVYYSRKFWPLALAFAVFMAFARIHNGMHYPSDVLDGAILGVLYGIAAIWLSSRKVGYEYLEKR